VTLPKLIQPAARAVGITKPIGWHTLRHTYSTLLRANRTDIKVMQELMRHASSRVTMDTYTQAVTAQKRKAQSEVVGLILTGWAKSAQARDNKSAFCEESCSKSCESLHVPSGCNESRKHFCLFVPAKFRRNLVHLVDSIWRPRRDLNPCYRRERAVS